MRVIRVGAIAGMRSAGRRGGSKGIKCHRILTYQGRDSKPNEWTGTGKTAPIICATRPIDPTQSRTIPRSPPKLNPTTSSALRP